MDKADFTSRRPGMIGESRFKKYAVLVPIVDTPDGRSLLFEKRAGSLRRQPGEVCFPGGKLEPEEPPQVCAIRETMEELCIVKEQIAILGPAMFSSRRLTSSSIRLSVSSSITGRRITRRRSRK